MRLPLMETPPMPTLTDAVDQLRRHRAALAQGRAALAAARGEAS